MKCYMYAICFLFDLCAALRIRAQSLKANEGGVQIRV